MNNEDNTNEILSQRNLDGLADALNRITWELQRADHPFGFADEEHPFGFGIGHNGYPGKKRGVRRPVMSTHAFHGRKRDERLRDDENNDEQNTSIFHGKDVAIESDGFPSSTSAFHGKRDVRELIKLLLTDTAQEKVKKGTEQK